MQKQHPRMGSLSNSAVGFMIRMYIPAHALSYLLAMAWENQALTIEPQPFTLVLEICGSRVLGSAVYPTEAGRNVIR